MLIYNQKETKKTKERQRGKKNGKILYFKKREVWNRNII